MLVILKPMIKRFLKSYFGYKLTFTSFWIEIIDIDTNADWLTTTVSKFISIYTEDVSIDLRLRIINHIFCVEGSIYKYEDNELCGILINYLRLFDNITRHEILHMYRYLHILNLKETFLQMLKKNNFNQSIINIINSIFILQDLSDLSIDKSMEQKNEIVINDVRVSIINKIFG